MALVQQLVEIINKEKQELIANLAKEYNFDYNVAYEKFVLNIDTMIVEKESPQSSIQSSSPSTPINTASTPVESQPQNEIPSQVQNEGVSEVESQAQNEDVSEVESQDVSEVEKSQPQTPCKKGKFVLPWSGIVDENCCQGLKNNYGIFTQCMNPKVTDCRFCKQCVVAIAKNGDEHPCGTVVERLEVGINEYKDPKGKKVVHYTQYMKRMNITKDDVLQLADGKFVDPSHFVSSNSKRGRPKKNNIIVHDSDDDDKKKPGRPKKIFNNEPSPTDIVNSILLNKLHTTNSQFNSLQHLKINIPTSPIHF